MPRKDRFCKFCVNHGMLVIEDELHCLLQCPLDEDEREKFLRIMSLECPHFVQLPTLSHIFSYSLREDMPSGQPILFPSVKISQGQCCQCRFVHLNEYMVEPKICSTTQHFKYEQISSFFKQYQMSLFFFSPIVSNVD